MIRIFRNIKQRFYKGPAYLGIRPVLRKGYQSPTLTAALWAYAWSTRWMTLPGRIILMCTGVLTVYSLMSFRMPIYSLTILLAAALIIDLAVGAVCRPRVRGERHLPIGIGARTNVDITYSVRNEGKRPAWSVHVDSLPPAAGIHFVGGVPFLENLAPGEAAIAHATITAERRGSYTMPALRNDTSFPFHFWRCGTINTKTQPLLVYPSFHALSEVDLPVGRVHHPGGLTLSSSVADSVEFFGCREYREGDNPRHIHWRSWARAGFPVVKEFREEFFPRMALLIDTYDNHRRRIQWHARPPENPQFEAAMSLAAALCDYLTRRDYVIDLLAAGPEIYRFQAGRSIGHLQDLLGVLAALQPHPAEPFAQLRQEIIDEIAMVSSAILVLLTWNDERRRLVEQLTTAGVHLKLVFVTETETAMPLLPPGTVVLIADAVRQGYVTSL
jgi:uncharacterized protein (DUF58 family)